MTSYCPVPGPVPTSPANRDYKAGFTTAMMLKDLTLAQRAAAGAGVATPMGALAQALHGMNAQSGRGSLDFSSVINMLKGS
jgi:3-hydroxyisobutyrate dehydrogenase